MPGSSDRTADAAPPQWENVPPILRSLPRWIEWDVVEHPVSKRPTKKPRGSLLDPNLPKPFGRLEAHRRGFVFTGGVDVPGVGRIHAFDMDGCRDPTSGAVSEWALRVVEAHGKSYTEITPSGTGLRQWLIVAKFPKGGLATIHPPFPPPPGVDKTVELQVFGSGSAQYVTVTGHHLPGTSASVEVVEDFRWLLANFATREAQNGAVKLPIGAGPCPTPTAVAERVKQTPTGAALLRGDWAGSKAPSASEAWWQLVRHALAAADNHGEAVVSMLQLTPWGSGLVDSKDPDRYARLSWVERDVARIAAKADAKSAAATFDDGFDLEAWMPPEVTGDDKPWLLHGPKFVGDAVKQLPFVVFGFLAAGSIVQIYGKPSCGKTPVALSLALSVACGRATWHGLEIDRPGGVVYMIGEGGPGLANRIRAQLTQYDDLATPFDEAPFYVTTRPGQLATRSNCAEWIDKIRTLATGAPLMLMVVDTQNMNFGEGDENSTRDMTAYFANLKWIAARLGCALVLVHHVGLDATDRGRGSSTQEASIDAGVEVVKTGKLISITTHKSRDWETPPPILATLDPVQLGTDPKGRPITAVTLLEGAPDLAQVFVDEPGQNDVAECLRAIRESDGRPISQTGLAALAGMDRRTLRAAVERAISLDLAILRGKKGKGTRSLSYVLTAKGDALCTGGRVQSCTKLIDELFS